MMAQKNLLTRLAKDLKRSPKKTAVLALLAVVAIWFWAPLVWKWVAPETSNSSEAKVETTSVELRAESPAGPSTVSESTPDIHWKNLTELFQSRQILAAGQLGNALKDPFLKPQSIPETDEITDEGEEAPIEQTTPAIEPPNPAELGLAVHSTLTGGNASWAQINGRLCSVGTVLVARQGGEEYEFEITHITPGSVTLSRGADEFVLKQNQSKTAVQLSQSTSRNAVFGSHSGRVVIESKNHN